MAKENTIQDFGEKIGGAKKDLWKSRGLGIADIIEWNDVEKEKYITKNNIWPTPDYEKLVDEGYSKTALYFIKVVKDALPTKPQNYLSDKEESQKGFIEFITHCKEKLLEVKTESDIRYFKKSIFTETEYGQKFMSDYFGPKKKVERAVYRLNPSVFKDEAIKKGFLFTYEDKVRNSLEKFNLNDYQYSVNNRTPSGIDYNKVCIDIKTTLGTAFYYSPETPPLNDRSYYDTHKHLLIYQHQIVNAFETAEELNEFVEWVVNKAVKEHEELENKKQEELANEPDKPKRKTKLVPPQLEHIQRTGMEVRTKTSIEGQDFLDDFKIKGGEFGNWLNELDRQTNMNFAYDSFKDLAIALDIKDEDISLGNRLNIAFGARGSGSALAHYEPDREVINLTKMKGAGSLAHEYGHALDNIFSSVGDYLSETPFYKVGDDDKVGKAVLKVVEAMTKGIATLEYSQEKQKQKIEEIHKSLQLEIDKFLRNNELTPEQEKEKEKVVKNLFDLLEKAKDNEEMKFAEITFLTQNKMKTDISDTLNEFNDFFRFYGHKGMNGIKYYQHNIEYFARKMDSLAGQLRFCKSPDYLVGATIDSKFYSDAKKIDDIHSKSGHGYWQSKCELFARAFACYVKDKLEEKGISNNYLTGHAEFPAIPTPSGLIYTYPIGEERQTINKAFDNLIEVMKEQELLHQRETTIIKEEPETVQVETTPKIEEYSFINDNKEYTVRLKDNEIIIDSPYEENRKNITFSSSESAELAYKSMINTIEKAVDSYEQNTPEIDEER